MSGAFFASLSLALDTEAIHLYKKYVFVDFGYVGEDLPESLNMICYLTKKDP